MQQALDLKTEDPKQSLVIAGGRVVTAKDAPSERLELDCADANIGPADVNAHTHLYSGLAPFEMPAPAQKPKNFPEILREIWWKLDRALDEKTLRAAARWYVAEGLLGGCGALVDHHESPNLIEGSLEILADACQDLGMRAVLCYGATDRNGGLEEGRAGLEECRRFITQNQRVLVRGAVGLHASFTVSDETISAAGELCRTLGVPLHTHLAEDKSDVVDAQERGYEGPLQRFKQLAAVVPGTIFAHGVHLNGEEVRETQLLDTFLVQNPRSNKGNGVGHPRFLHRSNRVALGTDGYPARMNEELLALVETAVQRQEKLCDVCRRPERGREIFIRAFAEDIGSEVGQRADIAAFYTEPNTVRAKHLIVDGQLVVRDGLLVRGDIEEIRAEARQAAPALWRKMAAL